MKTLRTVAQFSLNKSEISKLYNVTNQILLDYTEKEGCSYWFDKGTADELMAMSEKDFTERCKELAGNGLKSREVAKSLWDELGNIPVNEDDEIETDFETPFGITFEKGTDREDIWHWFEDYFDLSVAKDLMYKTK